MNQVELKGGWFFETVGEVVAMMLIMVLADGTILQKKMDFYVTLRHKQHRYSIEHVHTYNGV